MHIALVTASQQAKKSADGKQVLRDRERDSAGGLQVQMAKQSHGEVQGREGTIFSVPSLDLCPIP